MGDEIRTRWDTKRDDVHRLRQRADGSDRRQREDAQADIVIEHPRRLYLRAPNGTYWEVSVGNTGILSTTNVGGTLP